MLLFFLFSSFRILFIFIFFFFNDTATTEIYTLSLHDALPIYPTNWWYDGTEYLDASAYDGVEAHLIDSLKLSSLWPHPVLALADNVFIGHPAETNTAKNLLEAWALSNDGKFTQLSKTELSGAAQNLANFS